MCFDDALFCDTVVRKLERNIGSPRSLIIFVANSK